MGAINNEWSSFREAMRVLSVCHERVRALLPCNPLDLLQESLGARSVPGVSPRVYLKTGVTVSERVSEGVSPGLFGPQARDTFWTLRSLGPKGPWGTPLRTPSGSVGARDSCSRSKGLQRSATKIWRGHPCRSSRWIIVYEVQWSLISVESGFLYYWVLFRPTFRVKSWERLLSVLVNFSRFFPRSHSALVNFNRFFPRFQSVLVNFSQFQSVLVNFSQF